MEQSMRGFGWWVWLSLLAVTVAAALAQKAMPNDPMLSNEKCDVSETILCAEDPNISGAECEALNCCFDGEQCFYGNAVTVQCTKDGHFVVVVSRDSTVPRLALDSVFIQGASGESCSPADATDSFIAFYFPVSDCGTTMKEDGGYVVYENRLSSSYEVAVSPQGTVTRDSVFELLFQCRYRGSELTPLMADVYAPEPPRPVFAPGPLRVELRLANGWCSKKGYAEGEDAYSSYYVETDYPVTKELRQPVYVEVRILGRTDPNIVLLLESCWATATPSPLSLPQWRLLVNGCPYQEDKYLTTLVPVDLASGLPFPTHYKRFIVKMFTFVDAASMLLLKERVFIHCSTAVCSPTATDSCDQGCLRKRRAVAAVHKNSSRQMVMVSSGEVILTSPELPTSMYQSGNEVSQSLSYGLLGVGAAVLVAVALAIWWRSWVADNPK